MINNSVSSIPILIYNPIWIKIPVPVKSQNLNCNEPIQYLDDWTLRNGKWHKK